MYPKFSNSATTLFFVDGDIVFLRDPNIYYDDIFKPDWILASSQQASDIVCQVDFRAGYNTGFMMFISNERVRRFVKEIIAVQSVIPKGNNQPVVNTLLHTPRWRDLNIIGLPEEFFPCGYHYWPKTKKSKKMASPIPINEQDLFIVHNNWISGASRKMNRWVNKQLWYVKVDYRDGNEQLKFDIESEFSKQRDIIYRVKN
eukprot:TRINITY_DN19354_c0_g1_i1.p1 TRINITY_DN19354_c0_g1~~TRINITY_DN19354_c0_g1_i1.p1  ORF type:complete len:201 (+),score=19.31 TRINITY_DN19354_c0_g1_i1:124-726(+)